MLLVHTGRRNRIFRFLHVRHFYCCFCSRLAFFLGPHLIRFGFRPLFYQQFDLRRKMGDHFFILIQCLERFDCGFDLYFLLLATIVRVRCKYWERKPKQERQGHSRTG